MNTMKWLVKREFWEHKGGFFWTPAVVGSIIVLGTAALAAAGAGGESGRVFVTAFCSVLISALLAPRRARCP